ncbi:hypothetical protein [Nocardia sp. NPDC058705]|uniref:hypothetical protein n=1 Tax=Nocardia sp. NPDC058705 TaxID=3346609 RepID=UPI0036AACB6A
MTETRGLSGASTPSSEELRQQLVHRYSISAPSKWAFSFVAVAVFAAAASFGVEWERLAGASGWEAAVWPVAVTAVTIQALYCRVHMSPGWYPRWARWLFEIVSSAGIGLVLIGNGLHLGGYPHALNESTSVLVASVPGWCLMLSVIVAGTFMYAGSPPQPIAARWIQMQAHEPTGTENPKAPVRPGFPDLPDLLA